MRRPRCRAARVTIDIFLCQPISVRRTHRPMSRYLVYLWPLYGNNNSFVPITIISFNYNVVCSLCLYVFFIFNSFEIHRFNMSKEITLRWLSISSWNKCHRSCLDRKEDWQGYAGLTPIARGGYLRVTNRSRVNLLRVSWAVSVRDPFLTPQNNALH